MEIKILHPEMIKLNLGCGDVKEEGFIGIDQFPSPATDIIRDLEKGLPFCDNSAIEIKVDSVLEHIKDLQFFMNECWRVLRSDGIMKGIVPHADSNGAKRDPTHVRQFVSDTFDYFTGNVERYGFKRWHKVFVERPNNNGSIEFVLRPNKSSYS